MFMTCVFSSYALTWDFGGSSQSDRQIVLHNESDNYSEVELSASIPADGGVLSTTDSSITLKFTDKITYNAKSQTGGIILVKGSRTRVPVTVKTSGDKNLIVTPGSELEEDTTYKLYVYGIKDSKGHSVEPFTLSFSTPEDSTGTVASSVHLVTSVPVEKSTLSMTGASIVLYFSGNISYTSTSSANITLVKNSIKSVPISITPGSSSTLTIVPTNALSSDAVYKLYVSDLTDSSGNPIEDFYLTFNTDDINDDSDDSTSDSYNNGRYFFDISEDFWAYEAIMQLADLDIINGYTDNTFKPNSKVTRLEFASMFTKALDLKSTGTTQTFADVAPGSWGYSIVEAAKYYLTGYKANNGTLYFYGDRDAVREDMAVALVKALGYTVQSNNTALAAAFSDYDEISPALRNYVYTAYIEGIMKGDNNKKFNPQSTLTRAEAAVLIQRALQATEKVVVDGTYTTGEKVVIGSTKSTDATLSGLKYNGTAVTGFKSSVFNYSVILAKGTTAVPTITAVATDSGDASIVIYPTSSLPGTTTILVTAEDGKSVCIYTVTFSVAS